MRSWPLLAFAVLLRCSQSPEPVACGSLSLGAGPSGSVVFGVAGARCEGPKPEVAVSFTGQVVTHCDGDTFTARGTDGDGAPLDVRFQFSTPSVSCRSGKGSLWVKQGARVVSASSARFTVLD